VSELVNNAVRAGLAEDAEDLEAFRARAKEPTSSFENLVSDLEATWKNYRLEVQAFGCQGDRRSSEGRLSARCRQDSAAREQPVTQRLREAQRRGEVPQFAKATTAFSTRSTDTMKLVTIVKVATGEKSTAEPPAVCRTPCRRSTASPPHERFVDVTPMSLRFTAHGN